MFKRDRQYLIRSLVVILIGFLISNFACAVNPFARYNSGIATDPLYDTAAAAANAQAQQWLRGSVNIVNLTFVDVIAPYSVSCGTGSCSTQWYGHFQYYLRDPKGVAPDSGPNTLTVNGYMNYWCPAGYAQSGNSCVAVGPDPDKSKGQCDCTEGNPINPLIGNKLEIAVDYSGNGEFPIVFQRTFNSFGAASGTPTTRYGSGVVSQFTWNVNNKPSSTSSPIANGVAIIAPVRIGLITHSPMDAGWRHSYDRSLIASAWVNTTVDLYRGDSKAIKFTYTAGAWVADADQVGGALTQMVDASGTTLGWVFRNEKDEQEEYDAQGRLLTITNRAGSKQTLQYDTATAKLVSITDGHNRTLALHYDSAGRVSGFTAPDGGIVSYSYDTNGNLATVRYPDEQSLGYVYENASFPHALTGIVDENGARFATWSYDAKGNAVTSEHASGVDKVTLSYPTTSSAVAVDVSGAIRTYSSTVINGIAKASQITESCGSACSRSRSNEFDLNGNVSATVDWNGNRTTFEYDTTRALETRRTEAAGTSQSIITTTAWHPMYRLPAQIAEPRRLTTFTYDSSGNLVSKTVQATTDANGSQGMNAVLTGKPRVWRYTTNSLGQILSVTGPRTDTTATTTYSYDDAANLSAVINAAGHVTTLSSYDVNGRVGTITGPNGEVINLAYTPRGWMSSSTVVANGTSETTSYAYDNVGQLTRIMLPDSSTISYAYDAAHRLTSVSDSLGNIISYTLDATGNRTSEQVIDPSGFLSRSTTRIYDALNLLKSQTGGVQ